MVLNDIKGIAGSEFVFSILFIGLLWLVIMQTQRTLREQREIENQREDQIMEMYRNRETDLKDLIDKTSERNNELLAIQRNDSLNRERELMRQIERISDSQREIAETLTGIQSNLLKLEDKLDRNITEVWKEFAKRNE